MLGTAFFLVSFLLIILKAFFATSPINMITFTLGNSASSRSRYGKLFSMLSFATVYTVAKESIEKSLPYLERELALFPNVKVIMLMGDVAKKAFNMISKKETRKNAVPSISTYKLRSSEIFYKGIRIIPSYIMTGQNLLIEKSKFEMAAEDIASMYNLIMK